jgi:membrane-bound ClpP family serine protease
VLLVTVAFVLVSMQAMRVGLLTRFMGYLGIIAGVLVLFGAGILPIPIVQAYWLVALGVLLIGRWPTGMPPAWTTGQVVKWPSAQEQREARTRARGSGGSSGRERGRAVTKQAPKQAAQPVASADNEGGAKGSRSQTPKRKRKRRR